MRVRAGDRAHRALGQQRRSGEAGGVPRTRPSTTWRVDHAGALVYLAPSRVNLQLTLERWPDIRFSETREHLAGEAA